MKLKTLLLSLLAVSAISLTGAQAIAQTPMDDPLDDRSVRRLEKMEKVVRELRAIVFQGRDTGKPVVVQPAETEAQVQALADRVSDLEATLTRVTGQNESLAHDLTKARNDLTAARAANQQLETRLAALEKKFADLEAAQVAAAQAAAQPEAPPVAAAPEDPAVVFASARKLLTDGDYQGAETAFAAYVDRYPETPKTAEARYWLGKTLYRRAAYGDAATAYLGSLRGWPSTTWAPSAALELSRSLLALNRAKDACQVLEELARRYPKAAAPVPAQAATTRAQAKCAA